SDPARLRPALRGSRPPGRPPRRGRGAPPAARSRRPPPSRARGRSSTASGQKRKRSERKGTAEPSRGEKTGDSREGSKDVPLFLPSGIEANPKTIKGLPFCAPPSPCRKRFTFRPKHRLLRTALLAFTHCPLRRESPNGAYHACIRARVQLLGPHPPRRLPPGASPWFPRTDVAFLGLVDRPQAPRRGRPPDLPPRALADG